MSNLASKTIEETRQSSDIAAIFAGSLNDLKAVEANIKSQLITDAPILSEISEYLLNLGGKRIRPLLTILSYKLFSKPTLSRELIDTASGIELIHMATLLHDDIIDKSPTRRKQPSAYIKYGLPETLLTGDYLLVKAFGLCAKLSQFVISETEKACVALTEGEVLEGIIDLSEMRGYEEYVSIVGKKTASLFELSAVCGAHLADATESEIVAMREFGYFAGIAFQMIDDILDIVADEDLLGKPSGTDLKQKTPSLINILWANTNDTKAKEFFKKETISLEEAKQTATYLKQSPIVEEARDKAKEFAERALSSLDGISESRINSDIKNQLRTILSFTLERCL